MCVLECYLQVLSLLGDGFLFLWKMNLFWILMAISTFIFRSGLGGEEYRCSFNNLHAKKMNNWEEPVLFSSSNCNMIDVKQESSQSGYAYGHGNEEYQAVRTAWGQILPASSQRSCVTSFSSNMLDFSSSNVEGRRHLQTDHSSEVREMGF